MPRRRIAYCLFLCLALVLSSSYAAEVARAGDPAAVSAEPQLPPCHRAMDDSGSDKGGNHRGGCYPNFACCLGFVAETTASEIPADVPTHEVEEERVMHSAVLDRLDPPPKHA